MLQQGIGILLIQQNMGFLVIILRVHNHTSLVRFVNLDLDDLSSSFIFFQDSRSSLLMFDLGLLALRKASQILILTISWTEAFA